VPDGKLGVWLIDPHSAHLADALPKLKGLAAFAHADGNQFIRIARSTASSGTM
jgi:hypothetical protein